jgi:radical SAM superfamily enzyme YgiQ (UPF0313 family)
MTQLLRLRRRGTEGQVRPLKVLLVSPSYAAEPNAMYFPIGLAYISAYIRQARGGHPGHQVAALNMNHFGRDERYRALERSLHDEDPDVVGITGLTIAFREIERMVAFIRARSSAKIVLGGGITSCEGELVMTTIRPDHMVVSEGELIFATLLDAIATGAPTHEMKGVWSFHEERAVYPGEGPSIDRLDDLPFPDMTRFGLREHLALQSSRRIDYHETRFEAGKAIPITASRSCPYRCTFCYHAGMGNYRRHSMVNVVDHIQAILAEAPEASHISIYDELFSANKKRIHEFCDLLAERKLDITWYCQLRVDQLDQPLLDRMRASGCRHISFGFESGSDVVLESMDKKITAAQIADAVSMARKAQIGIQANFLFGDPAETLETLAESLRFQQENQLHFVDWSAVIPYPGTRVYDHAVNKGLIPDKLAFIRSMCNISGYLWNDMVNMTTLSDETYHATYVRLRELNDQNHRRRPIGVEGGHAVDARSSLMVLVCPHCGQRERQVLPYPPGARDVAAAVRGPIGMQGFNVVCGGCNRKAHLAPNRIPHVAPIFEGFQRAVDQLVARRAEVVVMPAMDRYWGVFHEDIDLTGLDVVAVLDSRRKRVGEHFLGRDVALLDAESARQHAGKSFVILPWVEYETALAQLAAAGVPPEAILSWNQRFAQALAQPAVEGRPAPFTSQVA